MKPAIRNPLENLSLTGLPVPPEPVLVEPVEVVLVAALVPVLDEPRWSALSSYWRTTTSASSLVSWW